MVNVVVVAIEQRLGSDHSPRYAKRHVQNRQPQRHHRYRHCHHRRCLLRSRQRQSAQHEPHKQAPRVSRKIDAGFELYRRNPRIAPASTIVIIDTIAFPLSNEITNITIVEKNAEPAASPSNPSIKLNAFVISSTQNIVSGNPIAVRNISDPERNPQVLHAKPAPIQRRSRAGLHSKFQGRPAPRKSS